MLNSFPYSGGHLMVAPYKQAPDFNGLTDDETLDLLRAKNAALDSECVVWARINARETIG